MENLNRLMEEEMLALLDSSDIECSDLEEDAQDDCEHLDIFTCLKKTRVGCKKVTPEQERLQENSGENELVEEPMRDGPMIKAIPGSSNETVDVEEQDFSSHHSTETCTEPEANAFKWTKKENIQWRRRQFTPPDISYIPKEHMVDDDFNPIPLEYFHKYIPLEMFEDIAQFTNIYALQNQAQNWKNTDSNEMKKLFGLQIAIGNLKFPRVRMCWENWIRIGLFTDNMSCKRFFQLRTNLHFINTLEIPKDYGDRFVRVRPLLDAVRKRCLSLDIEENLSIDEQMIPYRGKLNIKQYVKGKPCPWGIKNFVICGKSGLAYDFICYQGKRTNLDSQKLRDFGLGATIVLHLAERIKSFGHKLYFDNYFSTYQLFEILKQKGIYAAGTIRVDRFAKPSLFKDSDIKKKERGFSDEVVSRDGNVVCVKWYDNKPVFLSSNYVGKGVSDKVLRWDKKASNYLEIERPQIVKNYNESMGGVDLLDQMISYYRIFIRSKKWTLRIVSHFIDFSLVQSWIEYKMDCKKNCIPERNIIDLLAFRSRVAEALVYVKQSVPRKRGRPSSFFQEYAVATKSKCETRPSKEIRTDITDHFALHDQKKESTRCKWKDCKFRSNWYCEKCQVHLCMTKDRNCFYQFHHN